MVTRSSVGGPDPGLPDLSDAEPPVGLTEQLDAATAAFRVGYQSPSQFSREYGRQFGAPPRRDMERFLRPRSFEGAHS